MAEPAEILWGVNNSALAFADADGAWHLTTEDVARFILNERWGFKYASREAIGRTSDDKITQGMVAIIARELAGASERKRDSRWKESQKKKVAAWVFSQQLKHGPMPEELRKHFLSLDYFRDDAPRAIHLVECNAARRRPKHYAKLRQLWDDWRRSGRKYQRFQKKQRTVSAALAAVGE